MQIQGRVKVAQWDHGIYFLGIIITILIALGFSLVAPIFIINEYFEMDYMLVFASIIHTISSFTGILITGKIAKEKKASLPLVIGMGWLVVSLSGGLLLSEIDFRSVSVTAIGGVIGAGVAYLLLRRNVNGVKKRIRRGTRR